jgi:2-dehydro-3-deoxygluconokinase
VSAGEVVAEVVAFGECMVEVGLLGAGRAATSFGGDSFNAAVYIRRLGPTVAYGTAVGGEDPFSEGILALMAAEGVDAGLVRRVRGRLPGLYAIDRDAADVRRFFYWRADAPARDFFALADREALRRCVAEARLVYLSGVSLAIIGDAGRSLLYDLLGEARSAGAEIGFDPNFRPQVWDNIEQARDAMEAVAPLCRYISAGEADLAALYGRRRADQGRGVGRPGRRGGRPRRGPRRDRALGRHRAAAVAGPAGSRAGHHRRRRRLQRRLSRLADARA